jgi:hypothetical protein
MLETCQVLDPTRAEVVDCPDFVSAVQKALYEIRAEKSCTTSHQDALQANLPSCFFRTSSFRMTFTRGIQSIDASLCENASLKISYKMSDNLYGDVTYCISTAILPAS